MLTIAWTGTVCTNPPMCYISVRKERHSYDIIRRTGEFAINLTTDETGYIGINEYANEAHAQVEDLIMSGVTFFAERIDGVVVGTIGE